MKLFSFLITLLCFVQYAFAQKSIDFKIRVLEKERSCIIHLPAGYDDGNKKLPLVLIFHGGGGNAKQMQRYMDMDEIADKEHFICVYPQGINKQWNDGREFKESISENDDVLFINTLLDSLIRNYRIDTKRIFSTGISNGAFFSIYLSDKLSERLLAVAPVCGSIPEKTFDGFSPAKPISILLINGTKDPLVPYDGGSVGNRFIGSRGNCTSTGRTIEKYLSIDKTNTKPVITGLADNDPDDGCTATEFCYNGGINNTKVVLVSVKGGGHTLPGGSQYLPKFIIGRVCRDFNANKMIWDFFASCQER